MLNHVIVPVGSGWPGLWSPPPSFFWWNYIWAYFFNLLSQSIFRFANVSAGTLLTWSLFRSLPDQKDQTVQLRNAMMNEPFNCSTIKGGITTQRATPQSVHSNLFGHASLSPTFSVPSHSCLVVNTSITACPPSRNSTFLIQSGELGQSHIPTNGSSIKLSNNGTFCVLIRSSFHKAQRSWLCGGQLSLDPPWIFLSTKVV